MLKIYFDAGDIGTEFFAEKLEQGFFAGTTIGLIEPVERIRVAGLHFRVRPRTRNIVIGLVASIVVLGFLHVGRICEGMIKKSPAGAIPHGISGR